MPSLPPMYIVRPTGGYVFTDVCLFNLGGVLHLSSAQGGYPISGLDGGGTPYQIWMGEGTPSQVWIGRGIPSQVWIGRGIPSQVWTGGTPSKVWSGGTPFCRQGGYPWYPHLRLDGVPPSRPGMGGTPGTPPILDGVPPLNPQNEHLLRGGGVPLAFTQEDFLVYKMCVLTCGEFCRVQTCSAVVIRRDFRFGVIG